MFALVCLHKSPQNKQPIIITKSQKKLSIFLKSQKDLLNQIINFVCRESAEKLPFEKRFIVEHEDKKILCWKAKNPNFIYYSFCENNYSEFLGFKCLSEFEEIILNLYKQDFFHLEQNKDLNIEIKQVNELLKKYKDLKSKIDETHEKVNELNDGLRVTFTKLIDSDENLDELLVHSKDLNEKSKKLFQNSKKFNSRGCCKV